MFPVGNTARTTRESPKTCNHLEHQVPVEARCCCARYSLEFSGKVQVNEHQQGCVTKDGSSQGTIEKNSSMPSNRQTRERAKAPIKRRGCEKLSLSYYEYRRKQLNKELKPEVLAMSTSVKANQGDKESRKPASATEQQISPVKMSNSLESRTSEGHVSSENYQDTPTVPSRARVYRFFESCSNDEEEGEVVNKPVYMRKGYRFFDCDNENVPSSE